MPPAFGSPHVGETFSCSLCANNELPEATTLPTISDIRIVAEMQTPSQSVPLALYSPAAEDQDKTSMPCSSLQKIIRFDLKEEGNHVLAVNVSYTENNPSDSTTQATSSRVRTFRKLYQFLAQPCLSVKTKATELTLLEVEDKAFGPYGRTKLLRYALEAQLENFGEGAIILEQTKLEARPPFKSTSLNWDLVPLGETRSSPPTLSSRDILQVAYLVEQQHGVTEGVDSLLRDLRRDGRAVLGQLSIEWRSAMGEWGFLTTGNLLTRPRGP